MTVPMMMDEGYSVSTEEARAPRWEGEPRSQPGQPSVRKDGTATLSSSMHTPTSVVVRLVDEDGLTQYYTVFSGFSA